MLKCLKGLLGLDFQMSVTGLVNFVFTNGLRQTYVGQKYAKNTSSWPKEIFCLSATSRKRPWQKKFNFCRNAERTKRGYFCPRALFQDDKHSFCLISDNNFGRKSTKMPAERVYFCWKIAFQPKDRKDLIKQKVFLPKLEPWISAKMPKYRSFGQP